MPVPILGAGDAGKYPVWDGADWVMVDMPWHIQFSPVGATLAIVGGLSVVTNQAIISGGAVYNVTNAQNDEFGWDLPLAKGTWLLEYYFQKNANNAIAQPRLDGVNLNPQDFYAAGISYSNGGNSPGIVVGSSGKHRLSFKAATRNGSNTTGWFMPIQYVSMRRTA